MMDVVAHQSLASGGVVTTESQVDQVDTESQALEGFEYTVVRDGVDDDLEVVDDDGPGTDVEVYRPTPVPAPRRRPRAEYTMPQFNRVGGVVRTASRRAGLAAMWHTLRSPIYAVRIARTTARGAWIVTRHLWRWYSVADYREDARSARLTSPTTAQRIESKRRRIYWTRIVATVALLTTAGPAVVYGVGPVWAAVIAVGAAWVVCYGIGRAARPEMPLVDIPRPSEPGEITKELLDRILRENGILSKPTRGEPEPEGVEIVAFPLTDEYGGVSVRFDLPVGGKSAWDVIKVRDRIAGGLRVSRDALDIGLGEHEAQVDMWVSRRKPFADGHARHPLLDEDEWDIWRGAPFGLDVRTRPITLPVVYSSFLFGAKPRQGKSFAVRTLLMAGLMDPRVKIILANGKGDGTFESARESCDVYIRGIRGDSPRQLVETLERLVQEMDDRNGRYNGSKISPEICERLGMPVVLVVVDEVQRYLEIPEWGPRVNFLLTDLAKVGPSVGIIPIIATQKPDADTVPSSLRDQFGCRFSLRVMSWQASEAVLGTGTSKLGFDASQLRIHGVGWLRPDADANNSPDEMCILAQAYDADDAVWDEVCRRAAEVRREYRDTVAADVVEEADGEDSGSEPEPGDLLAHVVALLREQDRQSAGELLQGLPEEWEGMTARDLGLALREVGLRARRVQGRRFYLRRDAEAMLFARHS